MLDKLITPFVSGKLFTQRPLLCERLQIPGRWYSPACVRLYAWLGCEAAATSDIPGQERAKQSKRCKSRRCAKLRQQRKSKLK